MYSNFIIYQISKDEPANICDIFGIETIYKIAKID